jgi:hypothetical protein
MKKSSNAHGHKTVTHHHDGNLKPPETDHTTSHARIRSLHITVCTGTFFLLRYRDCHSSEQIYRQAILK